jgi:hypothetical protein
MLYIVHWADIYEDTTLSIDCVVCETEQEADKKVAGLVHEWLLNNSCDVEMQRVGNFTGIQSTDDNRELQIHIEEYDNENE